MTHIHIRRHHVTLSPDPSRVLVRPFIPSDIHRIVSVLGRCMAMSEEDVIRRMSEVQQEFDSRHLDIDSVLLIHYQRVQSHLQSLVPLTRERQLLIGAMFSGEYSLESAALFNPSIVAHPDQSGVPAGGLRFIMSLRATGEGHISSIEFRTGTITPEGHIAIDPVSRFVSAPEVVLDPQYEKERFTIKLSEMGVDEHHAAQVMAPLASRFTRSELSKSVENVRQSVQTTTHELEYALNRIQWLADSNYELRFPEALAMSERIIFPVSMNESNGIEDARFVRFVDDDATATYYATYTAYNGRSILPQLITTHDFRHFKMNTLNGDAAKNKGMALFPRRVGGRYAMLSRQDDENILIMFSHSPYHWRDPQILLRPRETWESVKIGNCGSPIETKAGWLVITHGVGPMRKYCIGAALLDLADPTRVIGRLRVPLLVPEGSEREGYVPNVVYSCGSLLHGRDLILPFAVSDRASMIACVYIEELLEALQSENSN